jgi:hypothetical protein
MIIGKMHWKRSEGTLVSSKGASRGIFTLWDNSSIHLEILHQTQDWVLICITHNSGKHLNIFNVYMLVDYKEKEYFWISLQASKDSKFSKNNIIFRVLM